MDETGIDCAIHTGLYCTAQDSAVHKTWGNTCKTGDRNKGRNCFSEKGETDTSRCLHMNNKEGDPGEKAKSISTIKTI